jgi:teichuronic acid biosynthesis glycosyltransferase TuaC
VSETQTLRILFVVPGMLAGAHLVFVRREAGALRAAGHEVEIFGFDNQSYLPWHFARQWLELRAAIRRSKPDVVHAQFGKFNALLAACAAGRVPVVITFRGTDINRNARYGLLRSVAGLVASQLAAFAARGIVCVSREIRSKVWARHARATIVLPTGVDLRTFVPGERLAARRQLGYGADERIVLFNAGKNPAVKDPELAAAAVEQARRQVGDVRFVVLDGTLPPEDVPRYMNAADCLLVTSKTEGSPTVVQEAMACNLPIVSVDVGDVRERLEGVSACALLPRDPAALGGAVAALLRAPRRSNGRLYATELDVAVIAARLAAFYGTALQTRSNRRFGARYRPAD